VLPPPPVLSVPSHVAPGSGVHQSPGTLLPIHEELLALNAEHPEKSVDGTHK
jgi:hypothetical protein